MKKIKRLIVGVVVLLVVVAVAALLWIDHIAKAGVETGATYALGVNTTVDSVDVGVLTGGVEMDALNVANPQGYGSDHFLRLGKGKVAVSLGSLMNETVILPELTLAGISMNLERRGTKGNYQVILDNLRKFESQEAAEPVPDEPGQGKKFVIEKVDISDVQVQVELLPIGGDATRLPVRIERIELKNVGSDSESGVLLSELTGILIQALLKSVVDKAGPMLPADIRGELTSGLAGLKGMQGTAMEVVGQVTAGTGETVKAAGEAAKQMTDEAGKALKDSVGGLLDSTKKEEK